MKVLNNFKLAGISVLLIAGLVACDKEGASATAANRSPVTLDQHAKDLIAQIKAKARNEDVTGGHWSPGDGVEIAPNVEFIYFTNRFGETSYCQVDFQAFDTQDGSKAIPKWSMELDTMPTLKKQFVYAGSFFGPKNSIRVVFDNAATPTLELNEPSGDDMNLTLSDNVMDSFMRAKKVTLNHGMAGTRKIEYQFDTSSFPLAVQLSNALCPM